MAITKRIRIVVLGIGMLLTLLALGLATERAVAQPEAAPRLQTQPTPTQPAENQNCLNCHNTPGLTATLPSGEPIYIAIDPDTYARSAHGTDGFACLKCHTNKADFPHPKPAALDRRDYTLQASASCRDCHQDQFDRQQDSVHERARAEGQREAATCVDCHNPHEQGRLKDPNNPNATLPEARAEIPKTCARCHSAIYDQYRQSVHGTALAETSDPFVPTCIDCHGVHNIADPTTTAFRLKSPQLCAACHANPQIMDRYGVSTQVLSTYLADFHGTTVTLFQKQAPDQITNKPVCMDCHGTHDIRRPDDPQKGIQVKENLLATCRQCHPDATANFPDSWLSHYIPSPEKHPLVYYVNVFYQFFIPAVIGGMVLFVASDMGRKLVNRRKK